MNLPDHIQAEIAKGPELDGVDQGYVIESPQEFAARIARMVAEDCAKIAADSHRKKTKSRSMMCDEAIRERYEL